MRAIGIDVGHKRIGLAASDELGLIASPLGVIERVSDDGAIEEILRIAEEQGAALLVVGIPFSLSGGRSAQTKTVAAFARKLDARAPLPVATADERYSTSLAQRMLREGSASKIRSKGEIDAAAAAVILQTHLDANRPQNAAP